MTEDSAGSFPRNGSAYATKNHLPFQRYLRGESVWSGRAWVFFCCSLVLCTIQAVPSWTHPTLLLGWDVATCLWIVGTTGAAMGLIVARCRWAGLLAGAVAGTGSLLAAVSVFHGFNHFPRYAVVIVETAGSLPGVALYWLLYTVTELRSVKSQSPP